ncbi:hypothetical protein [Mycolicibacterium gadium]|jgi:hypothetical protein|uniref:hypothetical protein n=1 Tax=Mycolicibacterium gadium TaxID=1794 RepID=UPI002FDE1842
MTETHHPSHSTPVTIIKTVLIDSWVHLYGCPQDGWWLYWSDGVANDWTEHYTELSHALLLTASLVYCGEHQYERFYAHSAEEFPTAAAQLLATTTTDPSSPEEHTPSELITADQAAQWAGRPLSVDDLERLADCIPNSSIPEAIDTIVFSWG